MQDTDFVLFCLNIDIQYEVISLYSHSIKADSDYTLRVLLVFGIKRFRPNKIASDWFDFVQLVQKSNPQQTRCSIVFDCQSQSNTNRSIEFEWIFVRFCSIRYPGTTQDNNATSLKIERKRIKNLSDVESLI